MGPALAMPKALDRAGHNLADMDLVDMHEAFAAQVLSVLKMLGSDAFARAPPGSDKAVGEIDPRGLNVHGGSVALGHPFGATGARMVTTMANELHQTGKDHACSGSARPAGWARRRCSSAADQPCGLGLIFPVPVPPRYA